MNEMEAVVCDSMDNYGGIMELQAENGQILNKRSWSYGSGDWKAYYGEGYMLRYIDSASSFNTDPKTYTKLAASYSGGTSDVLAEGGLSGWLSSLFGTGNENIGAYKFARLSPLDSGSEDGNITLSVDYGGKPYSIQPTTETATYYYIDLDDTASTALKMVTEGAMQGLDVQPDWEIVAFQNARELYLQSYTIEWTEREVTIPATQESPETSVTKYFGTPKAVTDAAEADRYAYELSGVATINEGTRGYIYADYSNVKRLTLDGLTYPFLRVSDAPVYLEGDNFLIGAISSPITVEGGVLNLCSTDGTGTLTLSTNWVSGTTAALTVDTINLHNVRALTLFAGSDVNALADAEGGGSLAVQYYDDILSNTELHYGQGWKQDAGTSAVAGETQAALKTEATGAYVKFYSTTTDPSAVPAALLYDKNTEAAARNVLETVLTEPAIAWRLHTFDQNAGGAGDASGSVALINGDVETAWTSGQDYTWNAATDALALTEGTVKALADGSYTVRVYFYDNDVSDATSYVLDIPLTVKNSQASVGQLTIDPESTVSGRGGTKTFTTAFTGDTPKACRWTVEGGNGKSTIVPATDGRSAVLNIAGDETIGEITVKVEAFSTADGSGIPTGTAQAVITVAPAAADIAVTCVGERPSGDGSYTLHNTTADGVDRTWMFEAAVTMNDGSTADPAQLHWELLYNYRRDTGVDAASGALTIDTQETGRDGRMELTAVYTNADGTVLRKAIAIYLSDEANISYTAAGTNGEISTVTYGTEKRAVSESGTWVPYGSTVVAKATPDARYSVSWFVNGESVMDNSEYTVDAENGTLTFTAQKRTQYKITAEYAPEDAYQVTYGSSEYGYVTAASGGTDFAPGGWITKGGSVRFTAAANTYCRLVRWTVNGETYEQTAGIAYTGTTLVLEDIGESVTVQEEFQAMSRRLDVQTPYSGSNPEASDSNQGGFAVLINGTPKTPGAFQGSDSCTFDQETLDGGAMPYTGAAAGNWAFYDGTMLDTVTVLATPNDGYQVKAWAYAENGKDYVTAEDNTTNVFQLPEDAPDGARVLVIFEKQPEYTVTVTTNSYENGAGKVISGTFEVPMSMEKSFTVRSHSGVTLVAVPETGSYLYAWSVEGAAYTVDGDTLTLLDVTGPVKVGAKFRPQVYTVEVAASGGGVLTAGWTFGTLPETGTVSSKAELRGGAEVVFTATPGTGCTLQTLKINGQAVTADRDQNGIVSYTISELGENIKAEAVFAEVEYCKVIGPGLFQVQTAGADTPDDDTDDTFEDAGTVSLQFVADGVSKDETPNDNTVEIGAGGTAIMTFTAGTDYSLDVQKLAAELKRILDAADSSASYTVEIDGTGSRAVIRNVDKNLDFSGMQDPFVRNTEPVSLAEVTLKSTGSGSLTAVWNGAVVTDGAQLPVGAELSITAVPDDHHKITDLQAGTDNLLGEATKMAVTEAYILTADAEISAVFAIAEYQVEINKIGTGAGSITVGTAGGSTIHSTDYLPVGSTLTVTAAADTASVLQTLVVDGKPVDGSSATIDSLEQDVVITAVFNVEKRAVTFNQLANGTLTVLKGDGTPVQSGEMLTVGTQLVVLTTPAAHYTLNTLTAGGTVLSGSSYIVDAVRENSISCSFKLAEVPVNWSVPENGAISVALADGSPVTSGSYVSVGEVLRITAAPKNENYVLQSLNVNGSTFASGDTHTADSAGKIAAAFRYTGDVPDPTPVIPLPPISGSTYTVAITIEGIGEVTVTSDGKTVASGDSVKLGTLLTITATPESRLTGLQVNGIDFVNGAEYEVYANTEIRVIFEDTLPYYLSGGRKVFLGFASDLNSSNTWDGDEYLAPGDVDILFAANSKTFDDVSGHWGESYIKFVTSRELFLGITDDVFAPDSSISRAMFATIVGRLYERSYGEIPAASGKRFSDCDYNLYYGKYVDWAAENGILQGYGDGKFGPNDLITREQMACILYNFAKYLKVLPSDMERALQYSDAETISDWAQTAAQFCQATDIIRGVGENRFSPNATATRAEAACVLERFVEFVLEQLQS